MEKIPLYIVKDKEIKRRLKAMGMAASQSRFLSLTARKSNVEYQGQQVNQERLALANESANLYSQLTDLDVPVPPQTNDYYKNVYSFTSKDINSASNKYTFTEIKDTPQGVFVTLTHQEKVKEVKSSFINGADKTAKISQGTVENVDENKLSSGYKIRVGSEEYQIYLDKADDLTDYFTDEDVKDGSKTKLATYTPGGDDNNQYYAFYVIDGTKYYIDGKCVSGDADASAKTAYEIANVPKDIQEEFPVVDYSENELGRITDITITVGEGEDARDLKFELACTSEQDEAAYKQAMLDYEYYKTEYEKQCSDINAKTKIIQEQDKHLELKLKQLDTEQNALKTEMDTIKDIIKDNVEKTFKTFG